MKDKIDLKIILLGLCFILLCIILYQKQQIREVRVETAAFRIEDKQKLINDLDSLIQVRIKGLGEIHNHYKTIVKETKDKQDEVLKTNSMDTLISIYYREKPNDYTIR